MKAPAKLLWTGGWDSTFRLLQLVLVRRRPVQPIYVIDPGRPSSTVEQATMKRIIEAVDSDLILSPLHFDLNDIAPHAEITEAFLRLQQRRPLGIQYEWLSRLVEQQNWTGVEIGIHHDARAYRPVAEGSPEAMRVFSRFSYPILGITKRDMYRKAERRGFLHLMHMTWFCHTPDPWGRPCGKCAPCGFALEEGMAWRLPARVRARHAAHLLMSRLRPKAGAG